MPSRRIDTIRLQCLRCTAAALIQCSNKPLSWFHTFQLFFIHTSSDAPFWYIPYRLNNTVGKKTLSLPALWIISKTISSNVFIIRHTKPGFRIAAEQNLILLQSQLHHSATWRKKKSICLRTRQDAWWEAHAFMKIHPPWVQKSLKTKCEAPHLSPRLRPDYRWGFQKLVCFQTFASFRYGCSTV